MQESFHVQYQANLSQAGVFPVGAYEQSGQFKHTGHDADLTKYYCELCKVSCDGKIPFESHLAGKKHQRMEHPKRPDVNHKPKEIVCSVCNVPCTGLETYNAHLRGKQHAKALKLQTSAGNDIPDATPQISSNKPSKPSFLIDPENHIEELYSGKNKYYSCRLCDCTCNDSKIKDAHLAGKKHRAALRKLKESLETATVPTERALHEQTESGTSDSHTTSSTERPLKPPRGFARPPGPRITSPSGNQALINVPPHLLADEHYMQTKLKYIMPSKEENDLMSMAVDAVCSALRQIHIAVSDNDDNDPLPSDQLNGVYLIGPAAIGLQLRGQLTADVVLVLRFALPPNFIDEVMEELEGNLKFTCEKHSVTFIKEGETHLVAEISPTPSSPHPSTSTAIEQSETNLSSSSDLLVARVRIRVASSSGSSDPNETVAASQSEEGLNTNPLDQLEDVRQTVWIKEVLSAHPDKRTLLNVARLVRCLIRDSLPLPWGEFTDYVLLILLRHLSFMDLAPPAHRSLPPRIRPGLLFRRFLESLASGILIDRDGRLSSMPDRPGSNLLLWDRLEEYDRIAATSAAQEALRLMAFRQLYKLLDLPKFVPPRLTHFRPKNGLVSPSTASSKRQMNDDENLIGSGCGEDGGFGGDTPSPDNQPTSSKVAKLGGEESGDCDGDEDKKMVCEPIL